jgi:NTP pyrophosphatase (non-canonical NTP hydrolase)
MNFQEYQAEATKTAIYPNKGNNPYYPTLGLCGEAGEVAEKIKKVMRDDGGDISIEKSAEIMKEIGDVLWYIAALCEELDIDMETCAILNIEKLKSRQQRGTLQGSGDNR